MPSEALPGMKSSVLLLPLLGITAIATIPIWTLTVGTIIAGGILAWLASPVIVAKIAGKEERPAR